MAVITKIVLYIAIVIFIVWALRHLDSFKRFMEEGEQFSLGYILDKLYFFLIITLVFWSAAWIWCTAKAYLPTNNFYDLVLAIGFWVCFFVEIPLGIAWIMLIADRDNWE